MCSQDVARFGAEQRIAKSLLSFVRDVGSRCRRVHSFNTVPTGMLRWCSCCRWYRRGSESCSTLAQVASGRLESQGICHRHLWGSASTVGCPVTYAWRAITLRRMDPRSVCSAGLIGAVWRIALCTLGGAPRPFVIARSRRSGMSLPAMVSSGGLTRRMGRAWCRCGRVSARTSLLVWRSSSVRPASVRSSSSC